jgi:hypothetical protein
MSEGEAAVVKTLHPKLRLVNSLTIAGGIGLLCLSIYPGFAIGCWLVLAYPLILFLGLFWLFIVIRAAPKPWGRGAAIPLTQILMAPVMVCATYAALKLYIPRRIAFRASMNSFAKQLPNAPAPDRHEVPLGKWLGLYHVDQFASDKRGGIYFRTGTAADMIDTYSYGFVYRPNLYGSPFGNAYYVIRPITKDWYWFQANNDW